MSDRLVIDGLVARPASLAPAEVAAMAPPASENGDAIPAAWCAEGVDWRAVPLADLLASAGALPEALWVQATGAGFSVPMPRKLAPSAIVAVALGSSEAATAAGGRFRLKIDRGPAFANVKRLEHLELRLRAGPNSARDKVRARRAAVAVT